MNIEEGCRYTILNIHPDDFYHVHEDELVGKTVVVRQGRRNRVEGDGWIFCNVSLEEPTEHYLAGEMTFYAVKLGELI